MFASSALTFAGNYYYEKLKVQGDLQSAPQAETQTLQEADSPSSVDSDPRSMFALAGSSDYLVGETVIATSTGRCLELPNRAGVFRERGVRQDCKQRDHPYIEDWPPCGYYLDPSG